MDFSQIAVLIVSASIFGLLAKFFKQPPLIGYIFAGIFLAGSGILSGKSSLEGLGSVGITLLLFTIGLEMNLNQFRTYGKAAISVGFLQVFFFSVLTFLIGLLLGFSKLESLYIGIAFAFSSTAISVTLLSEKKDLESLYGKIALGFLLVQDFIAVLILMFLSASVIGSASYLGYFLTFSKALLFIAIIFLISKKVFPVFFEKIVSSSQELLFVVSSAWALGIAALFAGPLGFTPEIGGFIAGISLSTLPHHLQIASKTKALRDFFLTLFFVLLGSRMTLGGQILNLLLPALAFSALVIIINPLIVISILSYLGYKSRTSFLVSLTATEISEFSLILIALGHNLGHVGEKVVLLTVFVAVITMALSSYLSSGELFIYKKLKKYLRKFERRGTYEATLMSETGLENHIVLVGCDRAGKFLVRFFTKEHTPFVVVDFNPKVFTNLTSENVSVIFGDINDDEVVDAANIKKCRAVISTTSSLSDDLNLLSTIKSLKIKPMTIFISSTRSGAIKLYEKGATLVIVPEMLAGDHIKSLLKLYGLKKEKLEKIGKFNFRRLVSV